jgi:hypothetical protein
MRIRPTRFPVLVLLLLISLMLGWGVTQIVESYGGNLPEIPWTTPLLLALLALGLVVIAFDLKRRIERPQQKKDRPERPREINPLHAARMVVLSKAASHGGAIITGLYLGFAWYLLPDLDSDQRRARLVLAGISALLGLVTTAVGLLMEKILRLPEE